MLNARRGFVLTVLFLILATSFVEVYGQSFHSSITFVNGSGEPALVKLVGPSKKETEVADGASRTVAEIAPGRYYLLVRYGQAGHYNYTKGDPFEITETSSSYTEISITLQKVVGGNLAAHDSSQAEFDKVQ